MNTENSSSLKEYAGSYQLSSDRVIVLGPLDEFGGNIVWLDLQTREIGTFAAEGPDTFIAHVGLMGSGHPIGVTFDRSKTGLVTSLTWCEPNEAPINGQRIHPHREVEITFENGSVELHGTLYLPSTPGPHPAVVFAHGSGDATRQLGFFPMFCVLQGTAMLSFDKRGCGESSGNWRTSGLDELAADVVAGVRMLRNRADILSDRVGVLGSSQGGWVGSLAAAAAPEDVAFLIVRAGAGSSVIEAVVRENEGHMRESGLDKASVMRGVAFARRIGELASEGEDWEKLDQLYQEITDEPWAEFTFPAGGAKESFWWNWYRLNGAVNSVDALATVRCPVLWFLAELDWHLPPQESWQALQKSLALANHPDYRIIMLPKANHGFMEAQTGYDSEAGTSTRYVSGFWDVLADWLKAHTLAS